MGNVETGVTFTHSNQKLLVNVCSAFSNALEVRDSHTQMHSERVMGLSVLMAQAINLSEQEVTLVEIASTLHDIGKIAIPDKLLLKPASLDGDELIIMRTHSDIGADLIDSLTHHEASLVASAIRHHHERYDGLGYPNGLAADNIPLMSRIITITDNYDAMAERRVYQAGRSHDEIIKIMQSESGSKHDPNLLNLFFSVIQEPESAEFRA